MTPGGASRATWAAAIFVAVLSWNLLSSGREPAWGDAHGMWEVADHLLSRGSIAIATRWPEDIPPGRAGQYYGIAPIGPSLIHLPGAALAQLGHAVAPSYDPLVRPLATHLGPSALGALACVVFFLLLGDLGIRARTASAATVIVWALRRRLDELWRVVGWTAVTGVPLLALALAYNAARWGSITRTGYEPYLDAYFGGSLFDGAWGMLGSPNKSALLYSPPLVLALIALPAAVRARPRLGLAMLAMVVPVFAIYCTYRSWSGDYAWGPRFFVWATPVVLVPIAWALDAATTRLRRALVIGVVALGIAVQLLGNALYWDHFIRIAIDAKNQWLGQPNRSGSYIAARGRGHCDSCFEDTYPVLWTPAFQPIRGHWWLVKSIARGDTPATAQRDAPWRSYTTLQVNLGATYPRARLDWWGMLWIADAPRTRPLGLAVLGALLVSLAWGVWRWRQRWRALEPDMPAAASDRANGEARP